MPRGRTGALVPHGADGLWRCRVTKERADGSTWRPYYSLGTADKALARRKLARVNAELAAGRDPFEAAEIASAAERVSDYAEAWLAKRGAQGIGMVDKERSNLELHALGAIGRMPVCDVRPSHIRSILEEAAAKGLKRKTVSDLRGVLHRLFRAALEDEAIENNPVAAVRTPKMREVKKERVILTDDEFARLVGCAEVDLELRMMALVARCEGGMRTGDLNRWDWTMIDRVHFAECFVPRAKTAAPQALTIPEVLAPFLRAWWERAGRPEAGAVFPVRIGKRAGEPKRPSNTYAKRLRRELFRAGVWRARPIEVPATASGTRTDLGKQARGSQLAPNPRDPLYFETETTLPVDFHSFRRAFSTALAEAGVNVQHAMNLAAHSDPRVHARYVMRTAAMRTVPAAALPVLALKALPERVRGDEPAANDVPAGPGIVSARDDSAPVRGGAARREGRNAATSQASRSSGCWTRTSDPAVNSRLLYQLS
jgi:integrase